MKRDIELENLYESIQFHPDDPKFGNDLSFMSKQDWEQHGTPKTVKFTTKRNNVGEIEVKVWVNGKYDEKKSYFTDDKQDAINTLNRMRKEYWELGYKVLN